MELQPPALTERELLTSLLATPSDEERVLMERLMEEYAPWHKVKYMARTHQTDARTLWTAIKAARRMGRTTLSPWPKFSFVVTSSMQRICHHIDMQFGGTWGNGEPISPEGCTQYLVTSIMEEAIASSQMEGASTTRRIARKMLTEGRKPIDRSQRMIWNNYEAIRYFTTHKDEDLTPERLLYIHRLITADTLPHAEDAGCLRQSDDVVVENAITHEVVHTPPSWTELPDFIETLCHYFNEREPLPFLHPLLRGIVLHFMVAYMHPFVDGNGRTARALFHFFMLRQGYWLTQYLSISQVILNSKVNYERAFLLSEHDDLDIGYFVQYHLDALMQALKNFRNYLHRQQDEARSVDAILRLGNLNPRQADIIHRMRKHPDHVLTVREHQTLHSITPTTSKSDIAALVAREWLSEIALNGVKRGYIRGMRWDELMQQLSH